MATGELGHGVLKIRINEFHFITVTLSRIDSQILCNLSTFHMETIKYIFQKSQELHENNDDRS